MYSLDSIAWLLDDVPLEQIAEVQQYLLTRMEESFEPMERLVEADTKDEIWVELEKAVTHNMQKWRETNAAA